MPMQLVLLRPLVRWLGHWGNGCGLEWCLPWVFAFAALGEFGAEVMEAALASVPAFVLVCRWFFGVGALFKLCELFAQ